MIIAPWIAVPSAWFSIFVNVVGGVVLLCRIALKLLPAPKPQDMDYFAWLERHKAPMPIYGGVYRLLQHGALVLGKLESQI